MKYIALYKKYNIQVEDKLYNFFDPDYIYIPFNNKNLLKKQDDYIQINEHITDNNLIVRSSISGKIIGLKRINKISYLVIENDYKEKKNRLSSTYRKYNIDNILSSIEYFGNEILLDKLKINNRFDNIVINTVVDEEYCKNDLINFNENIKEMLELIDLLAFIYKSSSANIIINENDTKIIENSLNIIGGYPNINITLVKDLYLLGRQKYLLDYLKNDSNNTLYLTIDELLFIINAVKHKKINDTEIITICGNAIKKSIVLRCKKYVLLSDIIKKYIKIIDNNYIVFINGIIGGYEANLDNVVITDDIKAIYIMKKESIKEYECTKCGKCMEVCPLNINIFSKRSIKKCIDCGLCNYICPSYINIRKYVKENK